MAIGRTNCGAGARSSLPEFTYSGTYTLIDDGDKNWRIKFLTSGTLTFAKISSHIDIFIVGGGGGSSKYTYNNEGVGGAGAGYTYSGNYIAITTGTAYPIVIGAGGATSADPTIGISGGASSAFGYSASGGNGGIYHKGGNGGSGGACSNSGSGKGGQDGANGYTLNTLYSGGTGQGLTTREFGESTGTLYATGGDGYSGTTNGVAKTSNTGNGGDGTVSGTPSVGASGIVVIRNYRAVAA